MRFIEVLSQETESMLQRIYKYSQHYRVRQRAHCILLSSKGYTTTQLQEIFPVDRITIYHWFDAWESRQLCGLYERKGRGRPSLFTPEQKQQIREWAKSCPKNINRIRLLIHEHLGIETHKDTIRNILKELHFSWHRIRRVPQGEPDQQLYQEKMQALDHFKAQDNRGEIDLRYFDASGFCLAPYLPYAWQEHGDPLSLKASTHNKRLNVLGLLNRRNEIDAYTFEEKVDTHTIIACFDDFCRQVSKKTVIVLDNASVHTSKAFQDKIPVWKVHNIEIFYLPPYSPELNLIEILWRFMKYEWIDLSAYTSWSHLIQYVENVLNMIGTEYKIKFS